MNRNENQTAEKNSSFGNDEKKKCQPLKDGRTAYGVSMALCKYFHNIESQRAFN